MKKLMIAFLLVVTPVIGLAAGSGVHLDDANIDISDKASLQRGAGLFINNCLSCHSAKYQRYNRMAKDLDLTKDEVRENLMFITDKIGSTMTIAMPVRQSEKWFGTAPPDLSVIARARGVDWLYTYMRSFYVDDSRPFGVNNIVFEDVGMPHVFWELQGLQQAIFKDEVDDQGFKHKVFDRFELLQAGSMSIKEFDGAMRDLTNFLSYVGEPSQMERRRLGVWVLAFLAGFFILALMLKREYWKDVH